ncbi:MAG: DegT/DnrJ/EryC1/StrS family aminotransferase [Planctomycetota bacterium]|jgi:dTDP-4-amino-4,6-dideoxygalactose transaminase
MKIPLVDLTAQRRTIASEIQTAMDAVIADTAFVNGPYVARFEAEFADYCAARHAIGVGNGTDAIRIALWACGVGAGDEVICPSHTFMATAEAISQTGALPVFAEIDADTLLMDPAAVAALVTNKTKAIVPVHLYGQPCDMGGIMEIAREHDLRVVEDCAQAHGARFEGKPVGTFGEAGTFSFFPGKNLGAYGDGGAVITDNADIERRVRLYKNHGREGKFEHEYIGLNSRLDGLQAAILSAKLVHLGDWTKARQRVAAQYDLLFADSPGIRCISRADNIEHSYHLYVVRIRERDQVLAILKAAGIGAGIHYPLPCHRQPAFAGGRARWGELALTDEVVGEIVSLPIYPEITEEQIRYVADTLIEATGTVTEQQSVSPSCPRR